MNLMFILVLFRFDEGQLNFDGVVVDKSFGYLLEWAETPCEDSDCDSCVDGVHSLGIFALHIAWSPS